MVEHAVCTGDTFVQFRSCSEEEIIKAQASRGVALVPIRVEFETDTHRIRDCFVWNLHENIVRPDHFARILCADLDLPANPWVDTIANQIRAQLEDHEGVASMDLSIGSENTDPMDDSELPECRVVLSVCTTSLYSTQGPRLTLFED